MNALAEKLVEVADELCKLGYRLDSEYENYEENLNLPYLKIMPDAYISNFKDTERLISSSQFDRYFRHDLYEHKNYQPHAEKILQNIFFLYFKGRPISPKFSTKKQKIALAKTIIDIHGWMFLRIAMNISFNVEDRDDEIYLAEIYRKKTLLSIDLFAEYRKKLTHIGGRYTY